MELGPTFGLPQETINQLAQASDGLSLIQTSRYGLALPINIKFDQANAPAQGQIPYGYIIDKFFNFNDSGANCDFSVSLIRYGFDDFPAAPFLTPSVAATTDTDGNLNATYNNGVLGVGATLTNAGANAAFSLTGYAGVLNDLILVLAQAVGGQRGLYKLTTVGDALTPWVLTRVSGYDTAASLSRYMLTWDTQNSVWWFLNTAGPYVIGTTNLSFANPVAYNGNQANNDGGSILNNANLNGAFWSDVSINGFFDASPGFNFAFVPRFTVKNTGPVSATGAVNVTLNCVKVL